MPWPAGLRVPVTRPAAGAALAAAFLGGTATGVLTLLRPGDALASACVIAALVCLVPSRRAATGLACLAGVAAAAAHGAAARDRALHPSLLAWFDAQAGDADRLPALVAIDGVLVTDASPIEDGVRLVIDVEHVRAGPAEPALPAAASPPDWTSLSGRVQLHVAGAEGAGRLRAWTAGRRIRAPAVLRRPQMLLNFGGPSPFWQRLRRPFVLAGSIKSAALVDVERGAWWDELAARARWRVRDAAARFIAPHGSLPAGVTTAILIGDRAGLDDDVVRTLQEAGTYHVIAISGGNIALLTGLCFAIFRGLVRSPRLVSALTLMATLTYGAVVGGDPSVARAVTAAAIYLGVGLAGLSPSPVATLRAAACALALANPLVVSDVGAWLSFGAAAGILLFASRIARAAFPDGRGRPAGVRVILRPLVVLVAATIAAELVLLPIAAAVFGRVTFAGLLLNLAAIPAMAFVEVGGIVTVLAGPIWPPIGWMSGAVASRAARILVSSSALADAWPWLWWRVPAAPWFWMAAYYAAVATIWRAPATRYGRRLAPAALVVTLVIVALAPAIERTRPGPGRLRVSILDVGQGDAILVQLPAGQALLVDTGGSPGTFDIGSRVVTPAAWSLGVRTLTWLALTHGDRDHAGGAYGVTEDLQPREIWEGIPVPRHPALTALRDLASGRGIVWRTVLAGTRVTMGAVAIEALHPAVPDWERQKVRNDDSLVLRIRYGGVELLLTGDAGAEFESHAPADLSDAPIRILKAGHHGSRTSTSTRLVDLMRPQVALISVGRGNLFGHPSAEVIDRLREAGAQIFRTDRDGAISVETDGVTARILTALGRSWTIGSRGSS